MGNENYGVERHALLISIALGRMRPTISTLEKSLRCSILSRTWIGGVYYPSLTLQASTISIRLASLIGIFIESDYHRDIRRLRQDAN